MSESGSVMSLPRTVIGAWLVAMMLRQPEVRRQLSARLNDGRPGWSDDEAAVVKAACELAMRAYFGAEYDVRDVTAFASQLREAAGENLAGGLMRLEALLRSALGESDVDVAGIALDAKVKSYAVATGIALHQLGFVERRVGELVAEAEALAFERGNNPPLAST